MRDDQTRVLIVYSKVWPDHFRVIAAKLQVVGHRKFTSFVSEFSFLHKLGIGFGGFAFGHCEFGSGVVINISLNVTTFFIE